MAKFKNPLVTERKPPSEPIYNIKKSELDHIRHEEHVRSEEFDCSKKTCNNDLISRRAVLSLQRQVHEHTGLFSETFYPGIPAWEVMQLPEVTEPYKELPVRCAACEWYDQKNYVCNHEQGMRQPSDSGFCSCGERRINDGEI